jgi:polyribonucleotide nucleotidyltransferase
MNLNFPSSASINFYGQKIELQTGLLAMQANSSVIATIGETTVMAVVVIEEKATMLDYFPLQIMFEERMYASGKIKGSRFQKREGRPTDNAILTGRLIDRSLRSLFNQDLKNSIQIVITVLSVDEVNQPDTVAVLAASTALKLAGIEQKYFAGPVSCVKVGFIDDYIVNPSYEQLETSTIDLTVSSNAAGVCMLEAGMKLVSEETLVKGIELGEKAGTELNAFQTEFVKSVKVTKTPNLIVDSIPSDIIDFFMKDKKIITDLIYNHNYTTEKNESLDAFLKEKIKDIENKDTIKYYNPAFYEIVKDIIQNGIVTDKVRPDKRGLTEIRTIGSTIDILPRVHGSSIFSRGQTQVMNILTLGTLRDALLQDDMEDFEESTKRYIHHYNFPAYSVGETGRYGAPSRRDIGHGNLAEKALLPVIPSEDEFPYTIRLVSECLGSNGSTSMASTCASTLSLMAGGVPIKEAIAGIAMGVVVDKKDDSKYSVLTDIQGMEDHFGHMDFKLTGGKSGLTALQLDNKLAGIKMDVLKDAIAQARTALDTILEAMEKTIDKPKPEQSQYAPMVAIINVPYEKVGEVIGSQGKVIKSIIARTNTMIDIEDNTGKTCIYGKNKDDVQKAVDIVMGIIKEYDLNEIINFTPTRQEKFGFIGFIESTDKETLLHTSQIPKEISFSDIKFNVPLKVKIIGFNEKKQMNITLRYGDYEPKPMAPRAPIDHARIDRPTDGDKAFPSREDSTRVTTNRPRAADKRSGAESAKPNVKPNPKTDFDNPLDNHRDEGSFPRLDIE